MPGRCSRRKMCKADLSQARPAARTALRPIEKKKNICQLIPAKTKTTDITAS